IIQEVEMNGLQETLRKYNLSQSLFHKWRRAYNGEGMNGLKPRYKTVDPVVAGACFIPVVGEVVGPLWFVGNLISLGVNRKSLSENIQGSLENDK
ncbi:hypothetical protein, partial [Hydrotalea sp.]|uniref:hypothetical protein n=1 Tax=Hydrotalea sp. TaxID=2881279 RepID=UPI003D0C126C